MQRPASFHGAVSDSEDEEKDHPRTVKTRAEILRDSPYRNEFQWTYENDDARNIVGLAKKMESHDEFFSLSQRPGLFGVAETGFTYKDMLIPEQEGMASTLNSIYNQFERIKWHKRSLSLTTPADPKQNQKDIQEAIWRYSDEMAAKKGAEGEPVCVLTLPTVPDGVPRDQIGVRGPLKLRSRVVIHIPESVTLKFVGRHTDYLTTLVKGADGKATDESRPALCWFEASPVVGYHPPIQTDITMENVGSDQFVEFVGLVGKGTVDGGFADIWLESAERFFDFKRAVEGSTQNYIRDHIHSTMPVEERVIASPVAGAVVRPRAIKMKKKDSEKLIKKMQSGVNIKKISESDEFTEWELPDCWPCSRPCFLEFFKAKGVFLHGITIKHSPMWSVHPVLSQNIWAYGVTIFTRGYNNDGIDPDMSQFVLIENCRLSPSDDGCAIKAGRDTDGYDPPALRRSEPAKKMYCEGPNGAGHILFTTAPPAGSSGMGPRTSGVVIRGCKVLGDIHPPLPGEESAPEPPEGFRNGIGIGSEGSAGVENVWMLGLQFDARATGVCLKTNPERRGIFKGIHIHGIKMSLSPGGHALSMKQNALMRTLNDRAKKTPPEGPLPDFQQNHMDKMGFYQVTASKIEARITGGGRAVDNVAYGCTPQGEKTKRYCAFKDFEVKNCKFSVEETESKDGKPVFAVAMEGMDNAKFQNVHLNGAVKNLEMSGTLKLGLPHNPHAH